MPVFPKLCVAVPSDEARPRVVSQSVHDQACIRQSRPALSDLALCKGKLEILADLLEQRPLQLRHVPTEQRDLIDGPVALKVGHELYHSLQQLRALIVLSRLGEAPELFVGCRQHLQPLQRRHGEGEIPLGAVQALDVGRHVCDHTLRPDRLVAYAFDLSEQLGELPPGGLDATDALSIRARLSRGGFSDCFLQIILIVSKAVRYRIK